MLYRKFLFIRGKYRGIEILMLFDARRSWTIFQILIKILFSRELICNENLFAIDPEIFC